LEHLLILYKIIQQNENCKLTEWMIQGN